MDNKCLVTQHEDSLAHGSEAMMGRPADLWARETIRQTERQAVGMNEGV